MAIFTTSITLEEYLNFDDGTDICYELVDGYLVEISTESDINDRIASFLYAYFLQLGIPYYSHNMPPPLLVVEVVSPKQGDWDYRHKRTEYAGRHIPEYWIVDPIAQRVTVMEWVDGLYQEQVFEGDRAIVSPLFTAILSRRGSADALTASQVLLTAN